MGRVRFDDSELQGLAVDLLGLGPKAVTESTRVIKRGATNIKKQLVDEAKSSRHFKGFASGISYDVERGGLEAVIGPEKGKPGSLANIAYFGTSRGGGTVPDPVEALHAEEPNVVREIGKIAGRL